MKSAVHEIEEKEGRSAGKSNRDEASMSNPGGEEEDPGEEYYPGAQSIAVLARALLNRVVGSAAVEFIESQVVFLPPRMLYETTSSS